MFYKSILYIMKFLIACILIGIMLITIILNPYEKREIENFESTFLNKVKSNYRRKKRKAKMIKDGFTSNVQHKIKQFVRKNNL
jgi:hypothetical protein